MMSPARLLMLDCRVRCPAVERWERKALVGCCSCPVVRNDQSIQFSASHDDRPRMLLKTDEVWRSLRDCIGIVVTLGAACQPGQTSMARLNGLYIMCVTAIAFSQFHHSVDKPCTEQKWKTIALQYNTTQQRQGPSRSGASDIALPFFLFFVYLFFGCIDKISSYT